MEAMVLEQQENLYQMLGVGILVSGRFREVRCSLVLRLRSSIFSLLLAGVRRGN